MTEPQQPTEPDQNEGNNEEHTAPEESPLPNTRAAIVAGVGGIILTIGILLALGTRTHHEPRSPQHQPGAIPQPTPSYRPSVPQTTPSNPGVPVTPVIRWRGTVTVRGPDADKDLDASPPRTDPRGGDLKTDWLETILQTDHGAQIATIGHVSRPRYAECRQAAYARGTTETQQLSSGDTLCLVTSQGRIAAAHVTYATQTSTSPIVTLRVTVWDTTP